MKVGIKKLAVEMDVKNRGVELEIRNTDGTHLGDLVISKSGLVWCPGRTRRENGVRLSWRRFIEIAESGGS